LCRGPLLSRAQYLVDVERWNYVDAREVPLGTMTPEEIDIWTKAIETKK
jgi:purine nucleoside permease